MKNTDTAILWQALIKQGNFHDSFYDKQIFDHLKDELSIDESADIHTAVEEFPPEIVLDAFFRAMAPLTAMYSEILELYARCGADSSSENVTILFDTSKSRCIRFDVAHFVHATAKLKRICELHGQLVLSPKVIHLLWGLPDMVDVRNLSFRRWRTAYLEDCDSWPAEKLDFISIVSDSPIKRELLAAFGFWRSLFEYYKSTGIKRGEWYSRICKEERSDSDLLMPETDYCLLGILNRLYFLGESFTELSLEEQKNIRDDLEYIISQMIFRQTAIERLKTEWEEFLKLPVWKHRYEIYSIWVFARIVREIPDPYLRFHVSNHVLAFPFSGACLASATLNGVTFDIWTELKTDAVAALVGKGRKKRIQPDYSIVCGTPEDVLDSVVVIECKQYKNPDKRNFTQALIDYTYNRPAALVLLADYGKADISRIKAGLKHIPGNRYQIFTECCPDSIASSQLAAIVYQTMMQRAGVFRLDKGGSAVCTLYWCKDSHSRRLDLDLYLIFKSSQPDQIYELSYKADSIAGAQYSGDILCAPGLEQIVIQDFQDGVYDLMVHNFTSGVPCFPGKPVAVLSLPSTEESVKVELPDSGTFRWWHIFQIDSEHNIIKVINKLS